MLPNELNLKCIWCGVPQWAHKPDCASAAPYYNVLVLLAKQAG